MHASKQALAQRVKQGVSYRVFHASSAARTFWRAVSRVNGGNGGLDSCSAMVKFCSCQVSRL